ncbi:MAG: hypothetical protein MZV70_64210 [Desulfobacterales bacterium]|nr:hypothetical protein [Desulfobacterales bacterium]
MIYGNMSPAKSRKGSFMELHRTTCTRRHGRRPEAAGAECSGDHLPTTAMRHNLFSTIWRA